MSLLEIVTPVNVSVSATREKLGRVRYDTNFHTLPYRAHDKCNKTVFRIRMQIRIQDPKNVHMDPAPDPDP